MSGLLREEADTAANIDPTLDCADAVLSCGFWKPAPGYVDEPPPSPLAARREWLRRHGVTEDDPGEGAWLRDSDGVGPHKRESIDNPLSVCKP